MDEKEIDLVIADDLKPGDLIMIGGMGFQTIKRVRPDESDSDYIIIDTEEEDDAQSYQWDERVTLYGY